MYYKLIHFLYTVTVEVIIVVYFSSVRFSAEAFLFKKRFINRHLNVFINKRSLIGFKILEPV